LGFINRNDIISTHNLTIMQRRNFIKSAGITAAAMAIAPQLFAEKKTRALGVQLYTIRDAIAKDLTGSLERLSKLGYNEVELFGYNGTFFGKTPKEFANICNGLGLKPISGHYLSGRVGNAPGTLVNGWQKAIDDAAELNLKYMVCAWLPPAERTLDQYKTLPALLNTSAEACAKSGIQFCYHNHDFEFDQLEGTMPYKHILQNTDAEKVKMEVDLYWVSKANQDPVALFENNPGRFPLWHVKDKQSDTGVFAEVGKGNINFDKIFAARKTAGLKHWFVEQDVCKGDPFDSLAISKEYVTGKKY